MKLLTALLLVLTLTGCVTDPKDAKSGLAGYYTMTQGGFNESMSVELAPDGSYVLDHVLFACVIGPNGEMPITHSREEGAWKPEGGVLLLEPKARSEGFPDAAVFVTAYAHRLLPKRAGFSRILVNADHPEHIILKRAKKT